MKTTLRPLIAVTLPAFILVLFEFNQSFAQERQSQLVSLELQPTDYIEIEVHKLYRWPAKSSEPAALRLSVHFGSLNESNLPIALSAPFDFRKPKKQDVEIDGETKTFFVFDKLDKGSRLIINGSQLESAFRKKSTQRNESDGHLLVSFGLSRSDAVVDARDMAIDRELDITINELEFKNYLNVLRQGHVLKIASDEYQFFERDRDIQNGTIPQNHPDPGFWLKVRLLSADDIANLQTRINVLEQENAELLAQLNEVRASKSPELDSISQRHDDDHETSSAIESKDNEK